MYPCCISTCYSQQIIPGALNKTQTLYGGHGALLCSSYQHLQPALQTLVLECKECKDITFCLSVALSWWETLTVPQSPIRMAGEVCGIFICNKRPRATKKGEILPWRLFEVPLPAPPSSRLSGVSAPGGLITRSRGGAGGRRSHCACAESPLPPLTPLPQSLPPPAERIPHLPATNNSVSRVPN